MSHLRFFALALPLAAAMQAGTIASNTVNFDLTPGMFNNVSMSASFTPFNTALGVLTQVELIATGNLTSTVELSGVGTGNFQIFGSDSYYTAFQLGSFIQPNIFDLGSGFSCTANGTVELAACDTGGVPMNATQNVDDVIAPPVGLGVFTTGSNIGFLLTPTDFTGAVTKTGTGTLTTSFDGFTAGPEITGSVSLLYTYSTDAAAAPEPGSMAMLGIGLAAAACGQFFRYLARKA